MKLFVRNFPIITDRTYQKTGIVRKNIRITDGTETKYR